MSISYVVNCDECGVIICGDYNLDAAIECAREDCAAEVEDSSNYTICEECVKERDSETSH